MVFISLFASCFRGVYSFLNYYFVGITDKQLIQVVKVAQKMTVKLYYESQLSDVMSWLKGGKHQEKMNPPNL